jgi:hypothetical protein
MTDVVETVGLSNVYAFFMQSDLEAYHIVLSGLISLGFVVPFVEWVFKKSDVRLKKNMSWLTELRYGDVHRLNVVSSMQGFVVFGKNVMLSTLESFSNMWVKTNAFRHVLFGIAYALQHSKTTFSNDPNSEAEALLFEIMTTTLYADAANRVATFLFETFETLDVKMSFTVDEQLKPLRGIWNDIASLLKMLFRFASLSTSGANTVTVVYWLKGMLSYTLKKHPEFFENHKSWLQYAFDMIFEALSYDEMTGYAHVFGWYFVVSLCALSVFVVIKLIGRSALKSMKEYTNFEDLDDWDKLKMILNEDIVKKQFETFFKNTSLYLNPTQPR